MSFQLKPNHWARLTSGDTVNRVISDILVINSDIQIFVQHFKRSWTIDFYNLDKSSFRVVPFCQLLKNILEGLRFSYVVWAYKQRELT